MSVTRLNVRFERRHHNHGSNCRVDVGCGGEIRKDPIFERRVNDLHKVSAISSARYGSSTNIFFDLCHHVAGKLGVVKGVSTPRIKEFEMLLTLMSDERRPELFGMSINADPLLSGNIQISGRNTLTKS